MSTSGKFVLLPNVWLYLILSPPLCYQLKTEPQIFTRKEFEKINQAVKDGESDAKKYIIIDNKLYDVTEFVEDHPGGADVLLTHVGKDASGKYFMKKNFFLFLFFFTRDKLSNQFYSI